MLYLTITECTRVLFQYSTVKTFRSIMFCSFYFEKLRPLLNVMLTGLFQTWCFYGATWNQELNLTVSRARGRHWRRAVGRLVFKRCALAAPPFVRHGTSTTVLHWTLFLLISNEAGTFTWFLCLLGRGTGNNLNYHRVRMPKFLVWFSYYQIT